MTSLLTHLANGVRGHAAANKIRAEHDKWAHDAQTGTTYYTLSTYGGAHLALVFTKRDRFGARAGQLLTNSGAGSWTLWYQHGPLTTQKMFTHADQRAADLRAERGAFAELQAGLNSAVNTTLDDLALLYPASIRALQAA